MKIQRNFYTELKEELLECSVECSDAPADQPCADSTGLFERLVQNERFRLLKKAADGQSMSQPAFERLADRALETAERLGLNVTIESRGLTAMISFRAPMIHLVAANDQIHIGRLLDFLSRADQMMFAAVPEDGEMLMQISLYYELAL